MMKYPEYSGMTYQQASREAKRLIDAGGWVLAWPRLEELRRIMMHERGRLQVGETAQPGDWKAY